MKGIKKLLKAKRILAVVLAIAMAATSMPATVSAADLAEAGDAIVSDDDAGLEESSTPEEIGADSVNPETADGDEPAEGDPETQVTGYKFAFDEDLSDYTKRTYYQGEALFADEDEGSEEDGVEASMRVNGNILSCIYLVNVNDEDDTYYLSGNSEIVNKLTYTWKNVDTDTVLEAGKSPREAGNYQLTIALKEESEEYEVEPITIDFEIAKAAVQIESYVIASVKPGSKKSDVAIESVILTSADDKNFIYNIDDKKTEENEAKDNEVDFDITIKDAYIVNPDEATLKADDKLVKNKEYVVTITPKFIGDNAEIYNKNYDLKKSDEKKIIIGDLKPTKVELSFDGSREVVVAKDGSTVYKIAESKIYGDTVSVPAYTATVKYSETDGAEADFSEKIEDAKTTGEWHSAVYSEWQETVTKNDGTKEVVTYCNLTVGGTLEKGAVPKDAGAYVYRVSYEGDNAVYEASYADIVVVIDPVELIIRPKKFADGNVFYSLQTAADVLAKVQYEIWDVTRNKSFTIPAAEQDYFWGTSYSSTTYTQPYEPTFQVYRIISEDGKVVDEEVFPNDQLTLSPFENITWEYEVRFTGQKAVYNAAGGTTYVQDINQGIDNYIVDTEEDTLKANVAEFSVNKVNAVIDTSDIIKGLENRKLENIGKRYEEKGLDTTLDGNSHIANAYGKTYDGKGLFADRADYKKAVVKTTEGAELVKNADASLTYTWYRNSRYTDVQSLLTLTEDGKYVEAGDFVNFFNAPSDIPTDAGIYALEIAYKDAAGKNFAMPEVVYFVIDKQKVYLDVVNNEYEEYSGITVSRFINDHVSVDSYEIRTELEMPAAEWRPYSTLDRSYPYAYDAPSWKVIKKQYQDGEAVKDKDGNAQYDSLSSYNTFAYETEPEDFASETYRLALSSFSVRNSNYTTTDFYIKNEVVQEADPDDPESQDVILQKKIITDLSANTENSEDNTARITVKKMGEAVLWIGKKDDETQEITAFTYADIIEKEKPYDGESIYDLLKDELAKLKVMKTEDGEPEEVTDSPLTYGLKVSYYDNDSYRNDPSRYVLSSDVLAAGTELEEELGRLAVDGGTYTIYVNAFRGDDNYQPLNEQQIANVTVTPVKLTMTIPELTDAFKAGQSANVVTAAAQDMFQSGDDCAYVTGYVERDQSYFKKTLYYSWNGNPYYGYVPGGYYPAWSFVEDHGTYGSISHTRPQYVVYDKKTDTELGSWEILKGEGSDRYELRISDVGELHGVCARNYYIDEDAADKLSSAITTVRGYDSNLRSVSQGAVSEVAATDSVSGSKHTLTVLGGIDYSSYNGEEGNFVAVQIIAPVEYQSSYSSDRTAFLEAATYKTSIEEAGGVIVNNASYYSYRPAIIAVFDAKKGNAQFNIRWEEDYIETFTIDFSQAYKLGNLKDAVAPKSLAFNSPAKSMVVGSWQDLDVKITKQQMGDIICLEYAVEPEGSNILSVNEYGKVTALSAGKATVKVYPVHLVNGQKEKIEGAKEAKVQITVKDVTAPKISKVTPTDDTVTVRYPYVEDVNNNYGYRREIYVLEGKNLKEDAFVSAISKMSNEQWQGIFAVAPVFLSNTNELSRRVFDAKKHTYINTVEYAISGLKANTDYTVYVRNVSGVRTLSDGKQVVLSAKGNTKGFTTTKAQVDYLQTTVADVTAWNRNDSNSDGFYYDKDDEIYYSVNFSKGSAQLNVEGLFRKRAKDPYADTNDLVFYPLALEKDLQAYYVNPKLSYYFRVLADKAGYYDAYSGKAVKPGEYYWSKTDPHATVNNKGKITFKQPGQITIAAVDTVSGTWSNQVIIYISAQADSIKGKTTTLQVGQRIQLENLVEYKQGKKTLVQGYNYYYTFGRIDRTGLKEQIERSGAFEFSDDGYITAVSPIKGSESFTLKDSTLGVAVNVTLKVASLAPVKNLKLIDVIDKRFTIQFERSVWADAYRIEVKDARGTTIRSIYAEQYDVGGWYDDKTGKSYGEYTIDGLTQQSKYTVTVTALFRDDVTSKAVSKKVTTTKLPAMDYGLADSSDGGMRIDVFNSYTMNSNYYNTFISGNSYTLIAYPGNDAAKYAVTDTLTWTSSNKKVATIKANSGTYSATLKAVKAGTTVIEVKSKILKKVIARYSVNVNVVGDAYSSNLYYGDNEDLRRDGYDRDTTYKELKLGIPAAVDLSSGQYAYYVFTAPEAGAYCFYRKTSNGSTDISGFWAVNGNIYNGSATLSKGEEVKIRVTASGSYTMNVEMMPGTGISSRTPLKLGNNSIKNGVQSGQYFVFTAEDDGLYQFSGNGRISLSLQDTAGNGLVSSSYWDINYWLDAGETVYLRSTNTVNTTDTLTITVKQLPTVLLKADTPVTIESDVRYYVFTAETAAEYEFVVSGTEDNKYVNLYKSSDLSFVYGPSNETEEGLTKSYMLGAGDTVLIQAGAAGNQLTVKVKSKLTQIEAGEKPTTLSGDNTWFDFTANETGLYRFYSKDAAQNTQASLYKDLNGSPNTVLGYNDFSMVCWLTKDQHGYLSVRSRYGGEQEDVIIAVEKITVDELTAEGATKEIESNTELWFRYTAGKAGIYTFSFNSDNYANVYLYTMSSLTSNNPGHSDWWYINGENSFSWTLAANETIYLMVQGGEGNITASAKEWEPGLGSQTITIPANSTVEFCFSAPETATYIFGLTNNYSNVQADVYTDSGMNNREDSFSVSYSSVQKKYYVTQGSKLYWRLRNTSTYDKISITLTIDTMSVVRLSEGVQELDVTSGVDKYLVFTPGTTGEYEFAFATEAYDNVRHYVRVCTDSSFSNNAETLGSFYSNSAMTKNRDCNRNQPIYLKIENSSSATIKISIRKVVADVKLAEGQNGPAMIPFRSSQWFSFTAEEETVYAFTFLSDATSGYAYFYRDKNGNYSTESLSAGTEKRSEKYLSKGDTIYWRVYNSDSQNITNVTVKVEEVKITEVTASETVTITSGETKLFKVMTPDTGDEYIITLASNNTSCDVYMYSDLSKYNPNGSSEYVGNWRLNSGDGNSINYDFVPTDVGADGKVYLSIENYNSSTDTRVTVKVKKRVDETITDEAKEVTVGAGEEQWFKFESANDTRYIFSFASDLKYDPGYNYGFDFGYCEWTVCEHDNDNVDNGVHNNKYGYSLYYKEDTYGYYVPKGSTVICKVRNRSISQAATVTLKAEAIDVQEITTEGTEIEIAPGEEKWFSYTYTAGEAGRCNFNFQSTDSNVNAYLYRELSATSSDDTVTVYTSSGANKDCYVSGTVYWQVKNTSTTDSTTVTVTAEAYEVKNLELGSDNAFDITDRWFSFIAREGGLYQFSMVRADGAYGYYHLYNNLKDSTYKTYNYSSSFEYSLQKDEVVYLNIPLNYAMKGTLKVEKVDVVELSMSEEEDSTGTEITLTNKRGFVKFTAEETGIYSFKVNSSQSSGNVYLYSDLNDSSDLQRASYSNTLVYPLVKDSTIYLKVADNGSSTQSLELTITKDSMELLSVDESKELSLTAGKKKYICFYTGEMQYPYYLYVSAIWDNTSWDGDDELRIYTPYSPNSSTTYQSFSWRTNMENSNPTIKYESFQNAISIYTNKSNMLLCMCIEADKDTDVTFSITSSNY